MASRKEYEMLFNLSAKMGGNFAGTFGKAQQQLLSLQKDVQKLRDAQSDVSAYQKQQNAVEATKKKLEVLQQQYDNIQKEMSETEGYSSDLENKLLSKQQQIDKTSASLDKETQKLGEMGAKLKEAGIDTDNLTDESKRLEAELGDLKKKQDDVTESADQFSSTAADAFSAVGAALAAAGIAQGLKEIAEWYKECINVAGGFEESMSNVEALSGASAGELQQLSDMAKELGATTKFTAKESADAMGYMAMAGWSAEQMLAGMPGVLTLAAAAGEDLASVSDIVTDSMTAFGLSASETSRYADVLAATAANANTSVGVMGETFKYAAPVAGALGYSVEDVSVAIGLMANAGIKGSNAGTALRNVFNGLLEGVTLTGDAFGECTVSAVRADGTMADFATTIDELRVYFDQMTEAERVNNAQAIAGQRGYAGLLAILNASEEDYGKLTAAINGSTGAAQRMADIKMDNMTGQLTLLNSAWEAVQTTVGEQFTPILAELYGEAAGILSEVNAFLQKNPALIKAITAFIGVLGLLVGGFAAYTAAAKLAAAASTALSMSIPGVNVILGVMAAIAAVTAAVVGLNAEMNESVPTVKSLTEAASDMRSTMHKAQDTYNDTVDSTLAAASVADRYITKLKDLEAAGLDTDEEQKQYHNTLALLCQTVPELADCIDLTTDTIIGGTDALRANTEAWKQNAIAQAYQEELAAIYASYADVLIEAEKNSIGLTQAQLELEAVEQKHQGILDRQAQLWNEAEAAAKKYNAENHTMLDTTAFLTQEYYDLDVALADVNTEIYLAEKKVGNYEKAIKKGEEATAEAEAEIALAEEAVRNLTDAEQENADATEDMRRGSVEVAETINSTAESVKLLTEEYNKAYEAAYSSITGQYELWEKADDITATKAGDINNALESQIKHWETYNQNLASLGDRTGEIEGLSDMIASFADGSTESVNAIAGMAEASDEDLKQMVKQWQDLQKAQKETSDTIAEFKTDFTQQMDELTQEIQNDIKALDMSADAAESGRALIQAFIDQAAEMEPRVQFAYAKLGGLAARAIGSASGSYGTISTHGWLAGPGYASGTDNATPGWHMVGENGPELVMMHGGETVLDAETTDAVLSSRGGDEASYVVTFAPVYTINGNMDASEIEAVLREHDENLREQMEEMLDEIESDRARRAYK